MKKKKTGIFLSKFKTLFEQGYSLQVYSLNHFTVRITHEENRSDFFDWFFTTGTLMQGVKKKGQQTYSKRLPGEYTNLEATADHIYKTLTK